MTIYMTQFDPATLQCTSPSVDSGFVSLINVIEVMGIPKSIPTKRVALYDGVVISDFPFNEVRQ